MYALSRTGTSQVLRGTLGSKCVEVKQVRRAKGLALTGSYRLTQLPCEENVVPFTQRIHCGPTSPQKPQSLDRRDRLSRVDGCCTEDIVEWYNLQWITLRQKEPTRTPIADSDYFFQFCERFK